MNIIYVAAEGTSGKHGGEADQKIEISIGLGSEEIDMLVKELRRIKSPLGSCKLVIGSEKGKGKLKIPLMGYVS